MSSYGFIKELIEKEHTPTPAYVFDLDKMKEFVEKVQSCLGESAQLCYAMKANPFRACWCVDGKNCSFGCV